MAKYPAMITTNKGRDLVSRSNATKKAITWTKIVVGDGDNNNNNIATLTNVISKKLEITVDKMSDLTNGQWKVQGTIDNSTLTEGFYCKEIAVFAKCEGDSDEILFAYTNGGNYVDYIPDKTTPVDSQKVTCQFVVGNAQNVTVTMNNEAFLRQEDLNNHDADNNAHQPLLNKWINKSFSKFKEAVIGVVKDALTDILDIQAKMDTNGFVRMGFLWGFTIQWGLTWFLNQNTYCDVTLPIRCNVLVALCTDDSASTTTKGDEFYVSWNSGFSNNNRTSIRFLTNRGNAGNFTWLCLGIS